MTGRTVGPPLFESLEVLGRDEVLRRLQAALDRVGRPTAAPELMAALSARSAWLQDRRAAGAGRLVYFAVTLVQVWLTSRHYDPQPGPGDRGDGGGAVQRRALAGPRRPGSTRRCSLPPGLRPPGRRDRQQGKGGPLHRGPGGGPLPGGPRACPAGDIVEAGGNDS